MVGKRHVLEHHAVVVLVERRPSAIAALHGQNPVDRPLLGLALIAPIRMLHAAQTKTNHRAIIHIRIKLVVEFEVPATRLSRRILYLPVTHTPHLLLQNPVGALDHARIGLVNAALAQRKQRIRRIPHRRHSRLHAERIAFFDPKLLKLIHCANHLRVIHGIPQATHGDDGIHHGGENRSQTIALFEMFQHPLLSLLQRNRAQRAHVNALKPVRHPVQHQKEIAPGDNFLRPIQPHTRFVAASDKQFLDAHLLRNFLERLLGVANRKRH